jgi:hypothetical protein
MSARVIACALLSLVLTGCWVFEEIDSGMKWMDEHASADKRQAEEDAPKKPPVGFAWVQAKALELWEQVADGGGGSATRAERTLTPGQVGSDIIRCQVDGRTHWMSVDDCGARGGRTL